MAWPGLRGKEIARCANESLADSAASPATAGAVSMSSKCSAMCRRRSGVRAPSRRDRASGGSSAVDAAASRPYIGWLSAVRSHSTRRCLTDRCCVRTVFGVLDRGRGADAVAGEGLGELRQVTHRVVGFGRHAEVVGGEAAGGVVAVVVQQVIPYEGEQTEVDIADARPLQVVEADVRDSGLFCSISSRQRWE